MRAWRLVAGGCRAPTQRRGTQRVSTQHACMHCRSQGRDGIGWDRICHESLRRAHCMLLGAACSAVERSGLHRPTCDLGLTWQSPSMQVAQHDDAPHPIRSAFGSAPPQAVRGPPLALGKWGLGSRWDEQPALAHPVGCCCAGQASQRTPRVTVAS